MSQSPKLGSSNFFVSSTYKQAGNGKDHAHLMRDIDGYSKIMEEKGKPKIEPSDFNSIQNWFQNFSSTDAKMDSLDYISIYAYYSRFYFTYQVIPVKHEKRF